MKGTKDLLHEEEPHSRTEGQYSMATGSSLTGFNRCNAIPVKPTQNIKSILKPIGKGIGNTRIKTKQQRK